MSLFKCSGIVDSSYLPRSLLPGCSDSKFVGSRLKAVETERERVRKEVPRLLSHPYLLKKTISLLLFLGVL